MTATYPITARNVPNRYPDRATYDKDAAHELLDELFVCDVSFVVDGLPRSLPTLYVRVDDVIYLHGSVAATPWLAARATDGLPICLTVTAIDALVLARSQFHHSANYRSLVAHGVARLVTDEPAKRSAMNALVEKVGAGRSAGSRPPTDKELAKTSVLALELDDVSVKRRTGGVGDDEADLSLPYWAGVVPLTVTRGYAQPAPGIDAPAPDYARTRSPWFESAVLRGEHVALEPLRRDDAADLFAVIDDDEVTRYLSHRRPRSVADMAALIDDRLAEAAADRLVPWTIRDARTGEVIGTTSYYDIKLDRESLCIGNTQIARSRWRTAVNTETKLLLLTRAFDTLGAGRVEWHTDILNTRSQTAVERLGATREGVLRRHKRRGDGTWRDTVTYSMIVDEWPAARDRLVRRLAAGHTG